jgi:NAD+ kinase
MPITKWADTRRRCHSVISRVGFVSRLDEAEALETAASLFRFALGKGLTAVPEEEFARLKHLDGGRSLSEMKVDLIVTVGGDGTVLKTSMLMSKPTTPILAVNMGRRGYLTEVPPGEAEEAINDCLKGRIRLEERMKLSLMHGSGITVDGLNEALVAPALPYKMIDVKIRFGNNDLIDCRADGLVIATPTGSTAHAYSAGGPVLDPSLDAFALIFICPVDPIHPVVLPAKKDLSVTLSNSASKAAVIVDGRHSQDLLPGASITIRKSKDKAVFVRFDPPKLRRSLVRFPAVEICKSESISS